MVSHRLSGDDRSIVHIVDDDATDRMIGAAILNDHGYPTRIWPSPACFLAAIAVAEPGCVLIDFGADSVARAAMAQLGRRREILPTVVLRRHGNIATAIEVMKAGAVDLLEKPLDPPVLVAAVKEALRELGDKRHRNAVMSDARQRIKSLSPREMDVLYALIRGASNKAIARNLDISARTVEIHRSRIMAKLGATSLPMVMHLAFSAGLLEPYEEYFAMFMRADTTESYV